MPGIEKGWFQSEIARSSRKFQDEVEQKKRIIVGVNEYVEEDEKIEIPTLYIDESSQEVQNQALAGIRAERDEREALAAISDLKKAAERTENLIPYLLRCAHVYCTEGEIVGTLKGVFGEYHEPAYTL